MLQLYTYPHQTPLGIHVWSIYCKDTLTLLKRHLATTRRGVNIGNIHSLLLTCILRAFPYFSPYENVHFSNIPLLLALQKLLILTQGQRVKINATKGMSLFLSRHCYLQQQHVAKVCPCFDHNINSIWQNNVAKLFWTYLCYGMSKNIKRPG